MKVPSAAKRLRNSRRLLVWAALCHLWLAVGVMAAAALAAPAYGGSQDMPLQLEVHINGQPTGLIGGFSEAGGRLASTPAELDELGLLVPEAMRSKPLVALDELPGLTHRYDRAGQVLYVAVDDRGRRRHRIDAIAGRSAAGSVESGTGAVLNYALVGTIADDDLRSFDLNKAASTATLAAQFDARLFTPQGALETSAIARSADPTNDGEPIVRLDTAWTSENPDTLIRWRFGDTVSGSLPWTRSIRLGGVQVQRSFELRPDLVVAPLPGFNGSAAVPSTVEIYVDNVKTFSRNVPAGPFSIANLPILSGAGTARIVVRDASGRETSTEQAFFASASLLAPGLYDYSLETGVARRSFGTSSADYDDAPLVSGSARYGFSDALTLAVHGEAGAGLLNAGIGATTALGIYGVLSGAVAFSHGGNLSHAGEASFSASGATVFAAFETELFGLSLAVQSRRATAGYLDLAAVTAEQTSSTAGLTGALAATQARTRTGSSSPQRALDILTLGLPIAATGGSLNAGFIAATSADGTRQRIATLGYGQRLTESMSAYASGFHDVVDGGLGVFAGLSIALGGGHQTAFGVSRDDRGTSVTADYSKSSSLQPGSVGWRASIARGASERTSAELSWTADVARVEAAVSSLPGTTYGQLVVTGAVAAVGDGVFLTNRIDDAFAVVDAGSPDVAVLHENRPVGCTGRDGPLLVTGLRSNQSNKLAIDPLTLPLDVEPPEASRQIVPARRGGVVVAICGRAPGPAAIVVMHSPSGAPLPVGSEARLGDGAEAAVVGHDGEVYLRGLSADNIVVVTLPDGTSCRAAFAFGASDSVQARIEGVTCR